MSRCHSPSRHKLSETPQSCLIRTVLDPFLSSRQAGCGKCDGRSLMSPLGNRAGLRPVPQGAFSHVSPDESAECSWVGPIALVVSPGWTLAE